MTRWLAALLILFASTLAACAQSTLLQAGPVTPGHGSMYVNSGTSQAVVQDSGTAAGGGPGVGYSEQGMTIRGTGTPPYANAGKGPYSTNWCDYDAPVTNGTGYHYFCMSPNAQGGGVMAYGAAGSAAPLPFNFILNGIAYPFPATVGGIIGPVSSVVNDLACWNNTVGSLLKDCGIPFSGPGSSVTNDVVSFADTTGQVIKDTGISFGSQAQKLFLATPNGGSGLPSFRSMLLSDMPAIAQHTVLGNGTGSSAPPTALTVLPPVDSSATTAISTGSTTARSLADRGADVINAKDYGAKGDGGTPDQVATAATLSAAGSICSTAFFPQGHYMEGAQLTIPTCIEIKGVGRPPQFDYADNKGTIFDFVNLPAATDGFVTSTVPGNAAQMLVLSNFQMERATRNCFSGYIVYALIENVNSEFCGGVGIQIKTDSSAQSFMFTLRNMFVAENGSDGIEIAGTSSFQSTTTIFENVYSNNNTGNGILTNWVTTLSFLGSAGDSNGIAGFNINNTDSTNFAGADDAENNGIDGYYINASTVSFHDARGAANNTSATPGHTNFILADGGSKIQVFNSNDKAATTAISINSLNSSSAIVVGGSYVGTLSSGSGGTIGNGVDCATGSPTSSFAAMSGIVTHC